jgi:hypothetical protein
MALLPMKLIQGLDYKLQAVQTNAAAAVNGIISLLNGSSGSGGSSVFQPSYFQGYHGNGAEWEYLAATSVYVDPALISGTATLIQRQASNLVVTTAPGNLPGITFTPASASAVYSITAAIGIFTETGDAGAQLTDGTTTITQFPEFQTPVNGTNIVPSTATGIYAPGVISPVTIKIQVITNHVMGILFATSLGSSIQWTVLRIA